MTVVELAGVIAGARGLAIATVRPPIGRVLGRMRHRIAGLEAMAQELARRRAEAGQGAPLRDRVSPLRLF